MAQQQTKNSGHVYKQNVPRDEAHIRDYWLIVLKYRWIVITCFLTIVLITTVYTFTQEPVYQATVQLVIQKELPSILTQDGISSYSAYDQPFYNTQLRILKSSPLAEEVIRKLDLVHNPNFYQPKEGDKVPAIHKQCSKIASDDPIPDEVMDRLLSNITIDPQGNSYVVFIRSKSTSPKLAADIANNLAKSYIEMQVEKRTENPLGKEGWLRSQLSKQKEQVEVAELAMQHYMESSGVISTHSAEREDIASRRLALLDAELQGAELERVQLQQVFEQNTESGEDLNAMLSNPGMFDNESVSSLRKHLVQTDKELAKLSVTMGPKHPTIIRLQEERDSLIHSLSALLVSIKESYKKKYMAVLVKEQSLRQSVEKQRQSILDLNQKSIQYEVLRREVETSRELYEILLRRARETKVESTSGTQVINTEIIEEAKTPVNPIKPRKQRDILLGLFMGLIVSCMLAFTIDYFDDSISSPEDIKKNYSIPILGMIPKMEIGENGDHYKDHDDLFISHNQSSNLGEAFRVIRSSLMFSIPGSGSRKILVTSATSKEGKTLATANLAVVMAQNGLKTLIIDGDMRKPRLHRVFEMPKDRGFSNLLVGDDDPFSMVVATEVENLHLLPSGPIPPNPADLLSSQRATEVFNRLEEKYDCLIIDSPPLLPVSDPLPLSLNVNLTVILVNMGKTNKNALDQAIERLRSANQKLMIGAVMNYMSIAKDVYGSYYYNYYESDDDEANDVRRKRKERRLSPHGHNQSVLGGVGNFLNRKNGLLLLAVFSLLGVVYLGMGLQAAARLQNDDDVKSNSIPKEATTIKSARQESRVLTNRNAPMKTKYTEPVDFSSDNELAFPDVIGNWDNRVLTIDMHIGRPIPQNRRDFIVSDPMRIVIDLFVPSFPKTTEEFFDIPENSLISRVRFGRHKEFIRFVFDVKTDDFPKYEIDLNHSSVKIKLFVDKYYSDNNL